MSQHQTVIKNKVGVTFCYLHSSVTTNGGGTYTARALKARKETDADVIVFLLPHSENAQKSMERIKRGREDLMSAVRPLILPFKICVAIGTTAQQFHAGVEKKFWSDIKY